VTERRAHWILALAGLAVLVWLLAGDPSPPWTVGTFR
jgi:hypothetical protein